jgi:lipoprotein-releasing system permease protein
MMLLSITAVALSCALLLITASLFTGFINALETSTTRHLGDIVLEAPSGELITDFEILIEQLRAAAAVEAAAAVLKNHGLLLAGPGKVRAVRVWGIQLPQRLEVCPFQDSLLIQKGQKHPSFDPQKTGEVGGFVGIGVLAQPDERTDEYNLEEVRGYIGQKMALTTGSLQSSPAAEQSGSAQAQFRRRVLRFTCTDVMQTGVWDLDEQNVFVPIEALSAVLYPDLAGPAADIIQIRLAPGVSEEAGLAIVRGIWENFAKDRFEWAKFVSIETSRRLQARLIAEYRKQMGVLLVIFGLVSLSVILLVFCIFSLLVMTKQKDIAILKSCGASRGDIAGLFLAFGFLNGLTGGILGLLLGWLITSYINPIEHQISRLFGLKIWKAGVYMFSQIPNTVDWPAAGWILLAAISASIAGALIPAVRAAWIEPVRLLRYE